MKCAVNPFQSNVPLLYPLKRSEFSEVTEMDIRLKSVDSNCDKANGNSCKHVSVRIISRTSTVSLKNSL